jgi:gamma-glutamyltranspeptidase/glutathione hydrolase
MLPIEAGRVLKNEDLAQTFGKLAANGAKIFYNGGIASAIVDEVKTQGGIFELEDMKAYEAKIRQPVIGSYRGYQIITAAPPSGGGTHLIELLNIMEGFDVKKLGHNSAECIHLFTEAMKMIYADKSMNAADPDFFQVPVDSLINKNYARKLRNTINKNKAMFDYSPSNWINMESNSTSHLSVVDGQGNIVALTQSINHWFGCGIVVPGTGILLNDHIKDFDNRVNVPNSIAPHKRPVSNTAPSIILKDGKPFLTVGSPGGSRIISAVAQIIMNVIDFNMSMDEAIEAPRVHCLKSILHVEGRIDEKVIEQLKIMGHKIKNHPDFDNYFGGAQGILINPDTKQLLGGADSRRDGVAVGY